MKKRIAAAAGVLLAVMLFTAGCRGAHSSGIQHSPAHQDEPKFPEYQTGTNEMMDEPVSTTQEYGYVPVGSIYTFGAYPQSGSNDPIEWIVAECKNGNALLVSRYGLDTVRYHNKAENVTWETSSVRKWLNTVFYQAAFSESEQAAILISDCYGEDNDQYNVDGGNDTLDRVFLLSADEACMYFPSDAERYCRATTYAIEQGAYINPSTGGSWWWLRSPGYSQQDAASVNSDGSMDLDDGTVTSEKGTVRPAIWIELPR